LKWTVKAKGGFQMRYIIVLLFVAGCASGTIFSVPSLGTIDNSTNDDDNQSSSPDMSSPSDHGDN